MIRFLTLLAVAISFFSACSSAQTRPKESAEGDLELLFRYIEKELELSRDSPFLVVTPIAMGELHSTAFDVKIQNRIPAFCLVLIQRGERITPTLVDKTLSPSWPEAIADVLVGYDSSNVTPRALALDLTRVLVDPENEFSAVISARDDIPSNISLSARYQYLKRRGLRESEIRSRLMDNLPPGIEFHAPRVLQIASVHYIDFFTWGYFGGEVMHWKIALEDPAMNSSRELIAKEVGSYDFYM